jgi:DNA-binding LytR/AlgR family response regulator
MMNLILHSLLIVVWKIMALQLMSLLALSSFKIGLYTMAILDIKMPKMNGFELWGELRKLDNKIKISFISAFDIQEVNLKQSIPLLYEEKPLVLKKPISIKDLALIIKKEIEQP